MHWPTATLVAMSLAMVGFAGCVETPRQTTEEPGVVACPGQVFVSLHFDQLLDEMELGRALVEAGYSWYPNAGTRFSTFTNPPGDVDGLVSLEPGISAAEPAGDGTLITVQERDPGTVGLLRVNATAEDVRGIVQETFGAEVVHSIQDEHRAHCEPAPGI